MLKSIEKTFGAWSGKKPKLPEVADKAQPRGRRVYLVHVPGAVQTQILCGCHAITRKHADWIKLGLTNSLYGGAFNSRLVMNIREDKGYTYSPRSGVQALRYPKLAALHDKVVKRPRLAAYLASQRRIAFNQQGIFRHYPELDEG